MGQFLLLRHQSEVVGEDLGGARFGDRDPAFAATGLDVLRGIVEAARESQGGYRQRESFHRRFWRKNSSSSYH